MNKQLPALALIPFAAFGASKTTQLKNELAARVAARTARGNNTPLHVYIDCSEKPPYQTLALEAAETAITRGANVNAQRTDAFTPLHFAIVKAPQLVPRLLSVGANPDISVEGESLREISALRTFCDDGNPKEAFSMLDIVVYRYFHVLSLDESYTKKMADSKTIQSLIKLLYEAEMQDTLGRALKRVNHDLDTPRADVLSVCNLRDLGLQRKADRAKNWECQLALLQRHLGEQISITDLLRMIRDYVGLDYTAEDNVPLTTMGGPASACAIEEVK